MSQEYASYLQKHHIRQSAGKTGVCWDNAMAESFFFMLKREKLSRQHYPTRQEVHRNIIRYIEHFYNNQRLHCSIGYATPNDKY